MVKKNPEIKYYEAVGRRKSSTALVRFYITTKDKEVTLPYTKAKKGAIYVNKKLLKDYFPLLRTQSRILAPLALTETNDRFVISIVVKGGGSASQGDAIIHGLARAIEQTNAALRGILKKNAYLTRDPRVKEKRKVGTGGKARRKKQSPKR